MRKTAKPACERNRGFSLIEFIGVLAIMAILAATLLPVAVRRADRAACSREVADLNAISNAFVIQTLRTRSIPDQNGWLQAVANWASRPAAQISTTPRGFNRALLIDANLQLSGLSLPYIQTNNLGLTNRPGNARLLLVSSLARGNPPVTSGIVPAANFDAIWNTAPDSKPSIWTNWPGNGEDLCLQRINLEPLFHRLILINRDATNTARFSIDSTNTMTVAPGGLGWSAYYLDGSVVGLCDRNGVPLTRYVLSRDISFVFEAGIWRGQVTGAIMNSTLVDGFSDQSSAFLQTAWYTGAHQGGNQQSALLAMYSFMFDYTLWANECPRFTWHNATSASQVPEWELLNDIGAANKRLDEFTGQNGLLK